MRLIMTPGTRVHGPRSSGVAIVAGLAEVKPNFLLLNALAEVHRLRGLAYCVLWVRGLAFSQDGFDIVAVIHSAAFNHCKYHGTVGPPGSFLWLSEERETSGALGFVLHWAVFDLLHGSCDCLLLLIVDGIIAFWWERADSFCGYFVVFSMLLMVVVIVVVVGFVLCIVRRRTQKEKGEANNQELKSCVKNVSKQPGEANDFGSFRIMVSSVGFICLLSGARGWEWLLMRSRTVVVQ